MLSMDFFCGKTMHFGLILHQNVDLQLKQLAGEGVDKSNSLPHPPPCSRIKCPKCLQCTTLESMPNSMEDLNSANLRILPILYVQPSRNQVVGVTSLTVSSQMATIAFSCIESLSLNFPAKDLLFKIFLQKLHVYAKPHFTAKPSPYTFKSMHSRHQYTFIPFHHKIHLPLPNIAASIGPCLEITFKFYRVIDCF